MFKDNKYTKWYFNIIAAASNQRELEYSEKHHIIPKCLGGTDEQTNIVVLSAREHYICHLLLTKMTDDHKIKFAFVQMCRINDHQKRITVKTSIMYEYIKRCNSIASSIRSTGNKNNLGKKIYYNIDTGEEKLFLENPGKDWRLGSPLKKRVLKGIHSKKMYYYNPSTDEVIRISSAEPPVGFIKGNPKAGKGSLKTFKGSSYYFNPITGEEKRSKNPIDGWIKGRSIKWITNGIENRQIEFNIPIPSGWKEGRTIFWSKRNKK